MECAAEANKPDISVDQRDRLLKMRAALLELATTHDWLDGQPKSNLPTG